MAKDLFGPAAFGATNPVAVRPVLVPGNAEGATDTWFLDCSSPTAQDGTSIEAAFLNFMLAQIRRAIRGMGIVESNLDDDMLLKAIQAAATGGGGLPAHTHDDRYFTESESDARFVKKIGDTMTGTLLMETVGLANALALAQGGGTRYSFYLVDRGSGKYDLGVYGYGGDAGSGLRVLFEHNGDLNVIAGGVKAGGQYLVRQDRTITTDGIIKVAGGTSADLSANRALSLDLVAIKAALGIGKKIIAIGSAVGSAAITFAAAEPDSAYFGLVICGGIDDAGGSSGTIVAGSLSAKTTTGCTVAYSGDGGGGGYDTLFYIIYR